MTSGLPTHPEVGKSSQYKNVYQEQSADPEALLPVARHPGRKS
jgi:hypothetical protein